MPRPLALSLEEIAAAFRDEAVRNAFPPILTIDQFAALFQVSLSTAKFWIGSGYFAGATARIGKRRRIWRDRAIQIAFSRSRTKPRLKPQTSTEIQTPKESPNEQTA